MIVFISGIELPAALLFVCLVLFQAWADPPEGGGPR